MLDVYKPIIIGALQIRQRNGEDPAEAIKDYTNLTAEEQAKILAIIQGEVNELE